MFWLCSEPDESEGGSSLAGAMDRPYAVPDWMVVLRRCILVVGVAPAGIGAWRWSEVERAWYLAE